MASMRDIKRRKSSIQSTQQITKAMKLVSTVKLQKARNRAEATNPYFNYMYQTVCSMLAKAGEIQHPYLMERESSKKAIIVVTSNRGLAGGYNSNVVKLIKNGGKPILLGFSCWAAVTGVSLAVQYFTGIYASNLAV